MRRSTSSAGRSQPRGRWRRIVARALFGVAILAVLLPASALLGLRARVVREAILTRVAAAVESRTGVLLSAEDFRLELRNGVVEIRGFSLSAAEGDDARPFLAVRRARAVVRWRTLLGEIPVIEALSVDGPRVDLGAALPSFSNGTEESDEKPAAPALKILRFAVADGEIVGGPAVESMDVWFDGWRAEQLRIHGAFLSGNLDVEEISSRLVVESHRRDSIALRIVASLSGETSGGSFAVRALRIDSAGLTVESRGRVDLESGSGKLKFDLDFEPAALFPDLTSGGHLRGDGDLELTRSPGPALAGTVRLSAAGFPAELIQPWLDAASVPDAVDLTGTRLDADIDLELRTALDRLHGNAELTWRRDLEQLLTVSVRSLEATDGVNLAFDAELAPAADGARRLSGQLRAPSWVDVLDGTLHEARLDVNEPDLMLAAERFGIDLQALLGWQPRGGVSGSLSADGPVHAPRLRFDARWELDDTTLALLSARTLGEPALNLGFDASLLPESPGRRELSGELRAPGWDRIGDGELRNGRLVLALPDVVAMETELARLLPGLLPQGLLPAEIPDELLHGTLSSTIAASGPIASPELRVEADWSPSADETVRFRASGRPANSFPFLAPGGAAELSLTNLNLSRFDPVAVAGRLGGLLSLTTAEEGIAASLRLDGQALQYGEIGPLPDVRVEAGTIRLEAGTLQIEDGEIEVAGRVASIRARVGGGDETSMVAVSDLDLGLLTELLDIDGLPPIQGLLDASLDFDPADPIAAVGSLAVSGIAIDVGEDAPVELGGTVAIRIADGRIVLPRTNLEPATARLRSSVPLVISGEVLLARDWKPGDDFADAIQEIRLDLDGTIDASLLNPFLAGGAASGAVTLSVVAHGSAESLTADVHIRGPETSLLYLQPYPTRLEELEVDLSVRDGEVALEGLRAKLNGGQLEMTGTFDEAEGLLAKLRFDGARYRLEFGITTNLSGELDIEWPPEGRRRIAGRVVVERAVLRRPITLSREMLDAVFDPGPETGFSPALDTIDLDLDLLTDQGFLIKNNVADLRADWGRLSITGTAAAPLLEGRVDVDPGGILMGFGQARRIDEASFEWSGDPAGEPRIVFESTSSADDPTILQSWRNDSLTPMSLGPGQGGSLDLSSGRGTAAVGGWETMAQGVMTQATSSRETQLSFEPLPLFGETDVQARYTLSQELSPHLTFVASTNPREAEAQTYILDVHRLSFLQSFRAQFFRNDDKHAGITLQQTLKLGGRPESETPDPFLGATRIEGPDVIPTRRLRKAIDYRKSDPFPDGAVLDVEVDVTDAMRRRGYPSATVAVDLERSRHNRVDLVVTVEPGTAVSFVFEGELLSSAVRRSIASGYRPAELGEGPALEEVQKETARALHALGFLDPRVDVEAPPADMSEPAGPRVVRVTMDGGRQVELSQLVVEGLPDEPTERVQSLFASRFSRVQLAIASPVADGILVRALKERGYPSARIVERELSDDGQTLVVRIESGERRRLVSVEIVGLAEQDRARLTEQLEVHDGDPPRSDRIGQDARTIERDLRDRGHADARVRARTKAVSDERPLELLLRYEVDPGPSYRIEEVRFEGLGSSRAGWVERVAGLESGQLYRSADVAEARGRLTRTGVFRQVRVSSAPEAELETESTSAETSVTFELEESRRWQLAYGGRWEDTRGLSVVGDLVNRNSFGIGHLTGVRLILGAKDQNLRLYHVIPSIVGERSSLELYVEGGREELSSNASLRKREAWAQLTFPLSKRTHNRPYIRFQATELIEDIPDPDLPVDEQVVSPLLGWQIAFDSESRRLGEQRRQGIFVGVDLLGSDESLGSDVSLLGVVSQLKLFLPVGHRETGRLTWAQFWRVGLTEARGQEVPLADRFRAGGEFSVRGYPTNTLGPLTESGVPLGGEAMFIVNQELHARLFGTVSALAFFDAGNVWEDRAAATASLFKSVGVGARYLSPFGPLRLDIGVPLDRRPDDPDYKVYFGFGSVF